MKYRPVLWCAVASAVMAIALVLPIDPAQAQDGHAQSQVVSAVPASFTPNINDGQTYAINQVGTRIVVGGSFTNESNHGSSAIVAQPDVFAFNATTGVLDTGFRPVLDGAVNGIEPGPSADTAYLVGKFAHVNGAVDKGIVLISTVTGAVVSPFKAPFSNGVGNTVRLTGGHLLFGEPSAPSTTPRTPGWSASTRPPAPSTRS